MILHKGVALGNDYLVVDGADLSWPITPARCAAICDRHEGVGADGILIADLSNDVALRILNPDGSEAEKSGNGLRIFAAYLHGRGLVGNDWFTVRLVRDTVRMRIEGEIDGALYVRVEMGRASFHSDDVAFRHPDPAATVVSDSDGGSPGDVVAFDLELSDGGSARITTVSLSNPHCVVIVDALDRADFLRRAPQLCTHPSFARGTNVQFARVADAGTLEVWIWERGVGETLASGSSACAAAAAAVRQRLLRAGRIDVRMRGGNAEVEIGEDWQVRLRGPARITLTATPTSAELARWSKL